MAAPQGAAFLVPGPRFRSGTAEEALLQVIDASLELIEESGDPRRHDLDAAVLGDPELIAGLDRGFHRGPRCRDGEDDLVLVLDDRSDGELATRHRLDDRLELGVVRDVRLDLRTEARDG